jgi:hypothetical protein
MCKYQQADTHATCADVAATRNDFLKTGLQLWLEEEITKIISRYLMYTTLKLSGKRRLSLPVG